MTIPEALRVGLGQVTVCPGRPRDNTATMLARIRQARTRGVDLLVFPEMAVPGCLIGDEWERDAFIRECELCGETIRQATTDITVVFGNVGVDRRRHNEDGRVRKYNALFVAENGRFRSPAQTPYPFVIKTLLPNYREFDDSRHFFDLRKLAIEEGCGLDELVRPVDTRVGRLGCVLCEDGWDMDYNVAPLRMLTNHGPDLFINISASPFTASKNHKRNRVFSEQARSLRRPLVYVNLVGQQNNGKTVFTFDGASCVYDCHGNAAGTAEAFTDMLQCVEVPMNPDAAFGSPADLGRDGIPEICAALLYGARSFMELCGIDRVVVGTSGGIDSAVVAALYRWILPPDHLLLVNMPSRYNSRATISLAHELADNLGCRCLDIPIDASTTLTQQQLKEAAAAAPGHRLTVSPLVRENIQARDRSSRVLAAVAAAFGGVFTCNANKSEATVGYTTLYGDLSGYLATIADVWKTDVYALARYVNARLYERDAIPAGTIQIVPSAELSPEQAIDAGKGDPLVYAYHDRLFKSWVEWWNRTTPEEILTWYAEGTLAERIGYDGDLARLFPDAAAFIHDLERWWNLYEGIGLAKRIQAPPVLAVTRRAFGFDHRESQMGARFSAVYRRLRRRLLRN